MGIYVRAHIFTCMYTYKKSSLFFVCRFAYKCTCTSIHTCSYTNGGRRMHMHVHRHRRTCTRKRTATHIHIDDTRAHKRAFTHKTQYTCMHTRTRAHAYASTHTWICTHGHTLACSRAHAQTHAHIRTFTHMHARIMHEHTHGHPHTHTHTHRVARAHTCMHTFAHLNIKITHTRSRTHAQTHRPITTQMCSRGETTKMSKVVTKVLAVTFTLLQNHMQQRRSQSTRG